MSVTEISCRLLHEEELPWFLSLLMQINYHDALNLSYEPNLSHSWILGAWLEEILVGAVQMVPSIKPDTAVIVYTAVNAQMRGRGIGTLLHRERERFLRENGRTKVVSAVAPWNGPSLNCLLNKRGYIGTQYLRDCYLKGEDKLKVEKDLLVPHNLTPRKNSKVVEVHARNRFLSSSARAKLESLINMEGFQVTKLVRNGRSQNYSLRLEMG